MVDLVARITRAFETVPYPEGTSLCSIYDDEGIDEFFSNRTWQSIGPLELACRSSALAFFTPQAYLYFLPSFMIAGLKFPRECGELARAIAFSLTPPKMNPNRPSFMSRWQLFATEQKRVTVDFLSHVNLVEWRAAQRGDCKYWWGLEDVIDCLRQTIAA